jgi:enoyl-CoA hydratase/carnithine racemase
MAEGAKLGYPEPKHGVVAAIVMANLVRQVGRKAAFELVALGEPIDAAEALRLGMVNRVTKNEEVVPVAVAVAEKLAAVARPAMAQTKRLFHEVADLALAPALERGREANRRMRSFPKG